MEFVLLIVHGIKSKRRVNLDLKIKEYYLMLLQEILLIMGNLFNYLVFKHLLLHSLSLIMYLKQSISCLNLDGLMDFGASIVVLGIMQIVRR
jgi:hypothetical protein